MICFSRPFLSNFLLPAGVFCCSFITPALGQQVYLNRGNPSQTRWMEGTLDLGMDISFSDVTDQATGDFDGNGLNDVLLVSPPLTEIAWNHPDGLQPFAPIQQAQNWEKALWDDEGKQLWVVARFPDRIEQYSFSGQVPTRVQSYPGKPRDIRIVRGKGITALGREEESLEFLSISGATEILIRVAAELSEAQYIIPEEGTPLLIMKNEVSGQLGMALKQDSKWAKVNWWEETNGTQQWEGWLHEDGQIGMLASCRDSLWYRELNLEGVTTRAWTPSQKTSNSRFWRMPNPDGNRIELVLRRLITKNLQYFSYERQTGYMLDLYDLGEPEFRLDPLLTADLDADGYSEVVYALPSAPEWRIHTPWWPVSRRLFWKRPKTAPQNWPGPVYPPDPWIRALAPLDSIEEVWSHEGRFHFRKGEHWQTLEATGPSTFTATPIEPVAPEKGEFCHQLVIPYLDLNGRIDNNAGIAEVVPHVWHQLTFIRRQDLSTEVWLDGQCLFDGLSKDHRYQYNALVFGAAFATGFRGYGKVSLDRVFLSGRAWNPEEIQSEFKNRDHNPDRYTADFWNFDSDSWAAGVSENSPTVQSFPESVPGVEGKAISFDGKDDALRQFAAVPPGDLTLAFFFRLDDETHTEPQVLIDLYGMYNTGMTVKWAPTSLLFKSETEGQPIRLAPPFEVGPSTWPDGAAPFLLNEELLLLSPEGFILEEGALGWQQAESPPCPEAISSKPWVWGEHVHVETENSELWQWNRTSGWNLAGYGSLPDSMVTISCAGGVFLSGPAEWNWLESPTGQRFHPIKSMPPLNSIAWTPMGEYVTFQGSVTQPWTLTKRRAQLMSAEVVFESWPAWFRWMGRAVILLTVILGLGWFGRGRLNRMSQAPTAAGALGLRLGDAPEELRAFLTGLMPYVGSTIDTDALDGLISFNGKETNETIRARRARYVRDTNAWAKEKMGDVLILRTKDPTDRRRTLYEISTRLQEINLD